MSDTASIVFLVAQDDVATIEEAYGKPDADNESNYIGCRRLAYHNACANIVGTLVKAIAAKVPIVGDIAPANQQPGYGCCATNGRFLDWPQIHGQPSVQLRADVKGRLTVDRENLRLARAYWALRQRTIEAIQQRGWKNNRRTKP